MAAQNIDPGQVLAQRRPLSPHLQVYRFTLTMAMSIAHRITAAALYAGTLLLAWFLLALIAGPGPFAVVSAVYGSIVGQLVLFLFTYALCQHLMGGIRHLVWDMGYCMDPPGREVLAQVGAIGAVVLTLAIWIVRFVV
jgi:succinate dehydrogenase / fumarate reductase, cytochrome b subunit